MKFSDREYEEESISRFATEQLLTGRAVPKRIAVSPVALWKIARRLGGKVVDDCIELIMPVGRATIVSDPDCPDNQFHDLDNPRGASILVEEQA